MITFTHDEKLLLRWLVARADGDLEMSDRDMLLLKLDRALKEDGVIFHIERVVPPGVVGGCD